jgi:hypothetical protein
MALPSSRAVIKTMRFIFLSNTVGVPHRLDAGSIGRFKAYRVFTKPGFQRNGLRLE